MFAQYMPPAPPLPAQITEESHSPGQAGAAEMVAEQALVATPHLEETDEDASSVFEGAVSRLPVELDVEIPVRGFRVRNLLVLEPGQIVESRWVHGEDVPLSAGHVQLAWSEFEVIDSQLAVRVTHLA